MDLASDPRVRLWRYETLVAQPEQTMRALCDWTGMGWSPMSMRFVHARSVKKANLPRLDPQVESLCQDLLARLDAEQAAQWLKVPAPRDVKATVPAGVVARSARHRLTSWTPTLWVCGSIELRAVGLEALAPGGAHFGARVEEFGDAREPFEARPARRRRD